MSTNYYLQFKDFSNNQLKDIYLQTKAINDSFYIEKVEKAYSYKKVLDFKKVFFNKKLFEENYCQFVLAMHLLLVRGQCLPQVVS